METSLLSIRLNRIITDNGSTFEVLSILGSPCCNFPGARQHSCYSTLSTLTHAFHTVHRGRRRFKLRRGFYNATRDDGLPTRTNCLPLRKHHRCTHENSFKLLATIAPLVISEDYRVHAIHIPGLSQCYLRVEPICTDSNTFVPP